MGDWNINIRGTGQHHNDLEHDADRIARNAVAHLVESGHTIHGASFTAGSGEDIVQGTEISCEVGETEGPTMADRIARRERFQVRGAGDVTELPFVDLRPDSAEAEKFMRHCPEDFSRSTK